MAVNAFIQFGGYTPVNTNKSWNHSNTPTSGTIIEDMVDETGASTGWSLFYQGSENPTQQSTSGINSVGSGDAVWVDEGGISQTFHYAQNGHTTVTRFGGLDNSKTYDIEFYSSWNSGSGSRRAEISVDNFTTTAVVQAQGNTTEVARLAGITPTSGVIALSWRSQDDDSHAHCNAVWIRENDAAGGGDTTITADSASAEWDGNTADIAVGKTVSADVQGSEFAALDAAVSLSTTVSANPAQIEAEGQTASIQAGNTVSAQVARIAATARQAAITLAKTVSAGTAAIEATANASSVAITNFISANTAQAAFATHQATVTSTVEIRSSHKSGLRLGFPFGF